MAGASTTTASAEGRLGSERFHCFGFCCATGWRCADVARRWNAGCLPLAGVFAFRRGVTAVTAGCAGMVSFFRVVVLNCGIKRFSPSLNP